MNKPNIKVYDSALVTSQDEIKDGATGTARLHEKSTSLVAVTYVDKVGWVDDHGLSELKKEKKEHIKCKRKVA